MEIIFQLKELNTLRKTSCVGKVEKVFQIFKDCKVDEWAKAIKDKDLITALQHLEDTAVLSVRKRSLMELAEYLISREN